MTDADKAALASLKSIADRIADALETDARHLRNRTAAMMASGGTVYSAGAVITEDAIRYSPQRRYATETIMAFGRLANRCDITGALLPEGAK